MGEQGNIPARTMLDDWFMSPGKGTDLTVVPVESQ